MFLRGVLLQKELVTRKHLQISPHSAAFQELPQKAGRSTSESSNFANQVPPKDPDRLAKIAYDYSEEELMATIEQEYCR
ncbi:hypothetical protein JD844_023811 [Phrynosoma platyrhinos]|uniref:Cystic fibrosis transmembrane conductance regulator n=1 Tax=Phrynosoma platyrhinos TaxID=52577 RepID=A0ABQ7SXK4_PHRPL|nr:hypothetical protein JD844_023811 [Phrynosoma platyrhinos]